MLVADALAPFTSGLFAVFSLVPPELQQAMVLAVNDRGDPILTNQGLLAQWGHPQDQYTFGILCAFQYIYYSDQWPILTRVIQRLSSLQTQFSQAQLRNTQLETQNAKLAATAQSITLERDRVLRENAGLFARISELQRILHDSQSTLAHERQTNGSQQAEIQRLLRLISTAEATAKTTAQRHHQALDTQSTARRAADAQASALQEALRRSELIVAELKQEKTVTQESMALLQQE